MQVFISHSSKDAEFAVRLAAELKKKRVDPVLMDFQLKPGDNIFERTHECLQKADYFIVVLSKNYGSHFLQAELSAALAREVSLNRPFILPVLLEDCDIPVNLRDRFYADFRGPFDTGLSSVLRVVKGGKRRKPNQSQVAVESQKITDSSLEVQLRTLREEFASGRMSLFCGAGISFDSGIPSWSVLLETLLRKAFSSDTLVRSEDPALQAALAKFYQRTLNLSPLMIAQYLKNMLGNDFLEKLRDALYPSTIRTSELIDAIVELCRPRRSRSPLHSIITFNFDDLVEQALTKNKVSFRSIYYEGQRCGPTELPVYHVHGFLPHNGTLGPKNGVIFSEDAYHSQFIDSFSWSNLVQLNHLNQNCCLFVGLSMTDPNLRRLLDVSAKRRTSDEENQVLNHYVIKRRYKLNEMRKQLHSVGAADVEKYCSEDFIKVTEALEEQDARNLGLNVIWVDDYPDILKVLNRIY